jgi:hypothetical protein
MITVPDKERSNGFADGRSGVPLRLRTCVRKIESIEDCLRAVQKLWRAGAGQRISRFGGANNGLEMDSRGTARQDIQNRATEGLGQTPAL